MHDDDDAFWLERTERARAMLGPAATVSLRPARAHSGGLDPWDEWLRRETRRQAEGPPG